MGKFEDKPVASADDFDDIRNYVQNKEYPAYLVMWGER